MKNLKIIILSVFLILIHSTSRASSLTTLEKEDLITRMSDNENVINYLKSIYFVHLVNSFVKDKSELDNLASKKYNDYLGSFENRREKINQEFPLFKEMNQDEKKEVLTEVIKVSKSFNYVTSCFTHTVGNFLLCNGITTVIQTALFWTCFGPAAMSDAAQVAVTDGAALTVICDEASFEMAGCIQCAKVSAFTWSIQGNCTASILVASMINCF